MPRMAPSKIMMLGRVAPPTRGGFLNPPRTSPRVPQNLLRQTLLGGLGATGRMLRGLGQVGTGEDIMADVDAEAVTVAAGAAAVSPLPGQAVPTIAAPVNGNGWRPQIGAQAGFDVFGRRVGMGATLGFVSLSLLSGTVSAIHGWRRDHTPISAWGWFTLGSMFPIITPLVALGQGFGRPRRRR